MLQHLLRFTLLLFFVTGGSYFLHIYLNREFFHASVELINFAYKFNVGITLIFTTSLILASKQLKEQLGFIFLIGGAVKIGVFLYLIKTSDLSISKSVFLHFFVPYVLCVILELIYVTKLINASNFQKDK